MLKVQEFLLERPDYETAIADLVSEYHIKVKEYDDMIVLNYDQIDSPRFNELVDDCRGLILSKDFETVYCRPFTRFYNLGEGNIQNFDFEVSSIYEKLDGTLMSLWYHPVKNIWNISTRKTANAEGTVAASERTFRQLFLRGMRLPTNMSDKDFTEYMEKRIGAYKDHTFIFEMTSPENRIVTPYSEYQDYLIGVRHNTRLLDTYGPIENFVTLFDGDVKLPKTYSFSNKEDIVNSLSNLKPLDEGYVVFNPLNEMRVKVKSPAYVAVHHLYDNGLNPKKIAVLVMQNEYEEFLAYFPEDREMFVPYINAFEKMKHDINDVFQRHNTLEDQKEFALAIKDFPFNSILFQMRKGKTFHEICDSLSDDKRLSFLKMFMEK